MGKNSLNSIKKDIWFSTFLLALTLFLIGCSENTSKSNIDEKSEITGSVIDEPSENCRLSDQSDCRPIEITRVEPTEEEEKDDEISVAESINITDKPEYNITLQNLTSLSLACEAGWKCIIGKSIAYQEANCSWHSVERCIHGCNENESVCRAGPICKVKSLKCENDDLMICGEDGYKWLLSKSCDKDCENDICTEDLPVNATLNITTNNATCISISNFDYNASYGNQSTDEYFTLKNSCSYSIDMGSWTAKDSAEHLYTFPSFSLGNSAEVSIVTGSGSNNSTTLYWGRGIAVWNNNGDTLYLNASNGSSVLIYTYP